MADLKRIMISLPNSLLEEVDGMVILEKRNRSELIRDAMKLYIGEKKKRYLREQMCKGYQEMASINLSLAQEGLPSEEEVQMLFENALGV
ncbi:transcriptional regulator, CopG family [Desulfonispora thiosulfatigenes DSM 11270]|uniref:Transcriptional regulator, CopG family n=1 Tax=Desulfonispora thiosulfatigenes DSM 11270 TaxID=656914 RepID=A0A1W1V8N0_DESTI|nr:ribbon-helix-helix protein, CopG family [Desulfonispora thiosulfatigenes]SMB89603.1 transcriptional regulator, CopG family [Desulfonispora thiosulfatigenes DSM 11270]